MSASRMEVLETLAAGQITLDQAEELLRRGIHSEEPDQEDDEQAVGVRSRGNGEPTLDQLVAMRIHGVTPEFVREMHAAGLPRISSDQLVALRIHKVSADFVQEFMREMWDLGFPDPTPDQLVAARIHNLTAESVRKYLTEMRSLGFTALGLDEVIEMMANRIDTTFVTEMRALGLTNATSRQLVKLRRAGMDAEVLGLLKEVTSSVKEGQSDG